MNRLKLFCFAVVVAVYFLIFWFSYPASATSNSRNCTGSYAWENMTWVFNGTAYVFNSVPVYCAFGCAASGLECAEPVGMDSGSLMAIGVVIGIVAFLFAYIAKNMQWGGPKYSWPLQVMFLFGSLLFIVIDVGLLAGYPLFTINNTGPVLITGYMLTVFFVIVAAFFLFILLIIKGTESMMSPGKGMVDER
jgi:hypothetical protein